MKWFSRSLWLAAWAVWLWLGFGLHRELPRELGPVATWLPLNPKEDMIAFIHNRPSILTVDDAPDDRLPIIRLRNERTGEIELEVKSEGVGIPRSFGFFNSFKHGFHGRCEGYPPTANTTWPIFVLSAATKEWRRIDDVGYDPKFHVTRPWVMFSRSLVEPISDAVVILDLESGRRVFDSRRDRNGEPKFVRSWHPFFIGGDRIGIPVKSNGARQSPALEIWSIDAGKMIRRIEGVEFGEHATGSAAGMLAWYDVATPYVTEVRDAESGNVVFSVPPEKHRIGGNLGSISAAPTFTADGKRILSAPAGGLFDIATGAKVWDAADHESVRIGRPPDRFEVRENWTLSLFGRSINFITLAVRRLDDGSFLTRSQYSTLSEYSSNADQTLFLENWKTVRELPLRVNWLHLALAQAILALPIILPWLVIRSRRRRKELDRRPRPEGRV